MTFENLDSLIYRPDRNRIYYTKPSELGFFEKYGRGAIKRALETAVSKLKASDNSSIHLEGCLTTNNVLRRYIEEKTEFLNVLLYPKYDAIRYRLKRTGKFTTTLHQQRSPIIITGINGLFIKNNGQHHVWVPGNSYLLNEIGGILLFNENPFDSPPKYFQEVIDYDPLAKTH